ncbi:MAG: metallophosphoesterase [Planctomycetes bacterium]|nr:metallophosphoesterase [Planctomycetota bacterium]
MGKRQRRAAIQSIETRHMAEREQVMRALHNLDRRSFLKVSAAAGAAVATQGLAFPHSFQPINLVGGNGESFKIAYISDSHLYEKKLNDRFVKSLLRAVDDVNRMDPQPDFVFYGGDLAQLGQPQELELGAQILKNLKAPLRIIVGEHDWYYDMGETWRSLFGADRWSFDHKGVHFVALNSVVEEDFWTARGLTPLQRMQTVAGLDNGLQRPFHVGAEQRAWLRQELEPITDDTPVVVFSHSPLYHLYKRWNFWTDDAPEVQQILSRFSKCTVIHGHTHQLLTNRIGNIWFHGLLSTAWPWPYAPEGLPELTIQMERPDPFNPMDGCGQGEIDVHADGLVDKIYRLWNRNPVTVSREYMMSFGKTDKPGRANLSSY